MLNKPTENILKFNLVAFNLSLPWQLGPDSPAHPAGPGVNRDATRLLRQGLNSRVKSGPICSQINSEKKEGKKSRLFFSECSQFAASAWPLMGANTDQGCCDHFTVSAAADDRRVGFISVFLCVPICSVSISKAQGNTSSEPAEGC